jgi:major intrinsic protein
LRAPAGFAPIAIGLALTLIHLISIPVTNTSVNPARSTGVALFVGDWAIGQLWLFWVAPIVGALLGAAIYHFVASEEAEHVQPSVARAALGHRGYCEVAIRNAFSASRLSVDSFLSDWITLARRRAPSKALNPYLRD